jgi:hypothetical protein
MSNTVKCPACDFAGCKASPTKTGGYSLSCSECGYQGFAKSPKAAAGIERQLGGAPAAPAAPAKKRDFMDEL